MKKINIQLFAKEYDLSDILSEKPSTIKIGEDIFEIHTGLKDVLDMDALYKKSGAAQDIEFVKKFLEIAFGKNNANRLLDRNFSMPAYRRIITSIVDAISESGEDEENGMPVNDVV